MSEHLKALGGGFVIGALIGLVLLCILVSIIPPTDEKPEGKDE